MLGHGQKCALEALLLEAASFQRPPGQVDCVARRPSKVAVLLLLFQLTTNRMKFEMDRRHDSLAVMSVWKAAGALDTTCLPRNIFLFIYAKLAHTVSLEHRVAP